MFGLKVKDAQKDDQKSSEYLSGEAGSQAGGSTQGTSTTTQRRGSSNENKVKVLQVAMKKKSDSEDNGQIELETNNLANAPIKRGSNNNQQVQLKADDFGTTSSSESGQSGTQGSTPSNPGPWTPWLTTEQIHNDPAKFAASILILYDAPYARNRTAIDRVDHLDPKVMTANYPPSWRTPKWNHHGLWDWKARDVLLQTTGFFNPRRHPEWFDGGRRSRITKRPGLMWITPKTPSRAFKRKLTPTSRPRSPSRLKRTSPTLATSPGSSKRFWCLGFVCLN